MKSQVKPLSIFRLIYSRSKLFDDTAAAAAAAAARPLSILSSFIIYYYCNKELPQINLI